MVVMSLIMIHCQITSVQVVHGTKQNKNNDSTELGCYTTLTWHELS